MLEKFLLGLEILLEGMAGIFLVAIVIILFILALNKITNHPKNATDVESQDS